MSSVASATPMSSEPTVAINVETPSEATGPATTKVFGRSPKDSRTATSTSLGASAEKSGGPGRTYTTLSSRSEARHPLQEKVSHPGFSVFLLALCIGNCILVLLDSDCQARAKLHPTSTSNLCSRGGGWAIFFTELLVSTLLTTDFFAVLLAGLRSSSNHSQSQRDVVRSNLCSMRMVWLLLSLICFGTLIPPPDQHRNAGGKYSSMLSWLVMFRVLRVLIFCRRISFLVKETPLWTMIKALLASFSAMMCAVGLAGVMMFAFASVAVAAYSDIDSERWGGILPAVFTLMKLATFDDWTSTMEPVLNMHPVWGIIFLLMYVLLVPFTLFPLMTAILTQQSVQCAESNSLRKEGEHQKEMKRIKAELAAILKTLDRNQDGEVSKEELRELWNSRKAEEEKARANLHRLGTFQEIEEIFGLISLNDPRHATVSREDFLENMLEYRRDKTTFMMTTALQHLRSIKQRVLRLECKVEAHRRETRELSVIGNPMAEEFVVEPRRKTEEKNQEEQDKVRENRISRVYGKPVDITALRNLFQSVDQTREGLLNKGEFGALMKQLHHTNTGKGEMERAWKRADSDNSGGIDFDEFLDLVVSSGWCEQLLGSGFGSKTTDSRREMEALKDQYRKAEQERMKTWTDAFKQVMYEVTRDLCKPPANSANQEVEALAVAGRNPPTESVAAEAHPEMSVCPLQKDVDPTAVDAALPIAGPAEVPAERAATQATSDFMSNLLKRVETAVSSALSEGLKAQEEAWQKKLDKASNEIASIKQGDWVKHALLQALREAPPPTSSPSPSPSPSPSGQLPRTLGPADAEQLRNTAQTPHPPPPLHEPQPQQQRRQSSLRQLQASPEHHQRAQSQQRMQQHQQQGQQQQHPQSAWAWSDRAFSAPSSPTRAQPVNAASPWGPVDEVLVGPDDWAQLNQRLQSLERAQSGMTSPFAVLEQSRPDLPLLPPLQRALQFSSYRPRLDFNRWQRQLSDAHQLAHS